MEPAAILPTQEVENYIFTGRKHQPLCLVYLLFDFVV